MIAALIDSGLLLIAWFGTIAAAFFDSDAMAVVVLITGLIIHGRYVCVNGNLVILGSFAYNSFMTLVDTAKIGRKGGNARAANMNDEELSAAGSKAVKARWDAYYKLHPDKLKAKLEREARKGTIKRSRPPKKKEAK
jgi:hypothetical protein